MGVTGISQFKSGMQQAQQSVKTLDAELKLQEKQLQLTGDKETFMVQRTATLNKQIQEQQKIVKAAEQALQTMSKNGVDPASQSYQKMEAEMLKAKAAMVGMQADMQFVAVRADEITTKSDKMSDSLNSINKKVSFDAVLGGIGKITDGMEAAARKIAAIASDVFSTMAAAASWADDENTLAAMYGIDVETLQRMQGASRTIDTSVEAIIKSQQKLKQNMASNSKEISAAFQQLGVSVGYVAGKSGEIRVFRDWEDVFWDAGEALLNYNDEIERDVIAQKIFGKSWMELMPLFRAGREEYEKTLADQSVVTEENVNKLNELDDALQKLDQDYQATKRTILAELAPAFTAVADAVSGLIRQFNEYLQTDEGKEKLSELSSAVTELFSGLTNVDFGQALDVAKGVLDGIVGALSWIADHWKEVETGIKGIGYAFLTLKAAEVVGTLANAANGLKTLLKGGASAAGSAAAGTGLFGAIGSGLKWLGAKALPIVGGAALGLSVGNAIEGRGFTPVAKTADDQWDSLYDPAGNVTAAGRANGLPATWAEYQLQADKEAEAFYQAQQAKKAAQSMIEGIYGEIIRAVDEYDPRTNPDMNTSDYFDTVLYPKILQAAAMYGMSEDEAGGIADDFYNRWIDMWYSNWPGTSSDLVENMKKALDANGNGLQLPVEPTLPENAAQLLSDKIGAVKVPVDLVWPDGIDGSNANGLPFVPYDGYISLLHKGERGAPANQNKNYNVYNNTYFDRTQVSGGVDADGLAARIVTAQKRALSAVGS